MMPFRLQRIDDETRSRLFDWLSSQRYGVLPALLVVVIAGPTWVI